MKLVKQIAQLCLGPLYGLATWLRDIVWRARRPLLVGVRSLIVRDGTVLLIRHRAGPQPWSLPGGGVERYERLDEAARREAREETGVIVRSEWLLGIYDRFSGGVSNYIAVFVCTPLSDVHPPLSLEVADAVFFPLDGLPANVDVGTRRRVSEYLTGERGIARLW